jgi:hypothetical protein
MGLDLGKHAQVTSAFVSLTLVVHPTNHNTTTIFVRTNHSVPNKTGV